MWKCPKEVRKTMNATVEITPEIVSASVARGLRAAVPERGACKLIARRIAATPRTVEAWLAGESAPNAASLLRMMAEYETVCDEVLRLIGADRQRRRTAPGPAGGAGRYPPNPGVLTWAVFTLRTTAGGGSP